VWIWKFIKLCKVLEVSEWKRKRLLRYRQNPILREKKRLAEAENIITNIKLIVSMPFKINGY